MTDSRWREIESVFYLALDIPTGQREEWLVRTCGADADLLREVRTLLDNDRPAETLSASVKEAITSLPASRMPRQAGPYALIEELGRGGMGTVYKARRADDAYDAVVAVKLVRTGMDTDFVLNRFRQERQTLARLNHPNVARLLDGGTTEDGVPYIVMEYIDGVRINEYCRRENLSIEQRLRLMLPVCLATDHAHRNFVVHRDIKPGNILVDRTGTPKLLDFGICKLLHASPLENEETMTRGLGMLTPDYASPEQVLGDPISARSDVYSLGAVLYELLTGVRPHKFEKTTLLAIEQAICETPVILPSEAAGGVVGKALRGDLDNIVMRAIEKDPQLRYQSAAALAEDIRRYLDQEPISARPATTFYKARKFIRRHRLLTAAIVTVLVVSTAGTVVSLGQARRAEARERQIRSLAKVFLYDVHDSVRDLPGATAARHKIVHTAVGYLDALAGSQPADPELLRELAAGYLRIADLQGGDARGANLGQSREALESYAKSIGFWDQLLARVPSDRQSAVERLNTMRRVADLQGQLNGSRSALAAFDRVEDGARELIRKFPDDGELQALLADILTVSARRRRDAGDLSSSLTKSEDALAIAKRLADGTPRDLQRLSALASAEAAVGMTKARLGDLPGAMTLYESGASRAEAIVAANPNNISLKRNLMIAYSHLGDVLGYPDLPNLGETAKAEAVYAKMAAIGQQIHAIDPKDARAETDYAIALMRWGVVSHVPAEREQRLAEALGLIRARLASTPKNLTLVTHEAVIEYQLGNAAEALGRHGEALGRWRRAIEVVTPHLDSGSDSLVRVLTFSARELALHEPVGELRKNGPARLARALAVAEKSASAAKNDDDVPARVMVPRVYSAYWFSHARLGDATQAESWRQRAISAWNDLARRPTFLSNYRKEMQEFERWRP